MWARRADPRREVAPELAGERTAGCGLERAGGPSVHGGPHRTNQGWRLILAQNPRPGHRYDFGTTSVRYRCGVRSGHPYGHRQREVHVVLAMGKRRGAAGVSQLAPQDVPGPEYRLLLLLRGLLLRALLLRSLLLGSH